MKTINDGLLIYVERIDTIVGLRLVWMALAKQIKQINYLHVGGLGPFCIRIVKLLNSTVAVDRLSVDFSSSVPDGGGLWYAAEKTIQDVSLYVAEQLTKESVLLDFLPVRTSPERRVAFLRKQIDIEIYWTVVFFLLAQCNKTHVSARYLILTSLMDLTPKVVEHLKKIDASIKFKSIPSFKQLLLFRYFHFTLKQFSLIKYYVIRSPRSSHQSHTRKSGMVAIQYSAGLDTKARQDDLWWYRASELPPSRLLLIFNRKKNPATDEIIANCNRLGYRYTILNDEANNTTLLPTDQYIERRIRWIIPDFKASWTMFRSLRGLSAWRWQAYHWLQIVYAFRNWQAFMLDENIRVLFDVGETGIDVPALVADAVDAIKIGFHWSDQSHPRARLLPLHHVYFVWGKHYQDVFQVMGSPGALIQIGCVYDDGRKETAIQSQSRDSLIQLRQSGVDYVVAVLDRSCGPTSHVPPKYHYEFYEALLKLAIENPEIGLLIKPKYVGRLHILSYYPQLETLLEQSLETGRVQLFAGEKHVAEACGAADIVVVLGPNSGGIICALKGTRVISWDPSNAANGVQGEWLRRVGWGDKKIVFQTMQGLVDALLVEWKRTPSERTLGNFENYINVIDGFGDGRAPERVANFVERYLEALDRGLPRDDAIGDAVKIYRQSWGDDKVFQ